MKLFSRVEKSGQGSVVNQNGAIAKTLLQHILPLSDAKTECCFFLARIASPEVIPIHQRVQKEIQNKTRGDNQQDFVLNLEPEDQKVNFKVSSSSCSNDRLNYAALLQG